MFANRTFQGHFSGASISSRKWVPAHKKELEQQYGQSKIIVVGLSLPRDQNERFAIRVVCILGFRLGKDLVIGCHDLKRVAINNGTRRFVRN